MKKIIFILILSILIIYSCSKKNSLPQEIDNNSGSDIQKIEVRKQDKVLHDIDLTFQVEDLLQVSGPIEKWSGQLEVEGQDIDGLVKFLIKGESILKQGLQLVLPAGEKKIKITLDYQNSDGSITRYQGTAHIVLNANKFKLHIKLITVIIPADPGVEDPQPVNNQITFYTTFIHRTQGYLITGATMKFYQGTTFIKEVMIDQSAQPITLPYQGLNVSQIATPYTYTVSHPNYVTLSGSMKIGVNDIEVDGNIVDYWQFVNFSRYMDYAGGDTTPPQIILLSAPSYLSSSVVSFNVLVTASDNIFLSEIFIMLNGQRINYKTGKAQNPYVDANIYDFVFEIQGNSLISGTNNLLLNVIDPSGNKTERSILVNKQ